MKMVQWFLIEDEADYKNVVNRYEQLRETKKDTHDYKEKRLLAHLINKI